MSEYEPSADDKVYRFDVEMFCGGCSNAVNNKLRETAPAFNGIRGYKISLATETVDVYTAPTTSPAEAFLYMVQGRKMVFRMGAVSGDAWDAQEVRARPEYKAQQAKEKEQDRRAQLALAEEADQALTVRVKRALEMLKDAKKAEKAAAA